MGDAHAAQGDSELDGTAVETSITGRVKITLHKKAALPKLVQVGHGGSRQHLYS
jgi:acetamidase/formamidase